MVADEPATPPTPPPPPVPAVVAIPVNVNQTHTLPRRHVDELGRNHVTRRSVTGRSSSPEPLLEYFVPRSASEFNLAATVVAEEEETDLSMPLTTLRSSPASKACTRSREKMVTFEEDTCIAVPVPVLSPGDVMM